MPSQNMPIWYKHYFELKTIEKKQTVKALYLHLKAGHKFINM